MNFSFTSLIKSIIKQEIIINYFKQDLKKNMVKQKQQQHR